MLERRQWLRACLGLQLLAFSRISRGAISEVEIRDYKFQPDSLEIRVGDTVRWVNREKRTSHTILFAGPDGLESERLLPADTWQRRFDRPGAFAYGCGPHPEMQGLIVVKA